MTVAGAHQGNVVPTASAGIGNSQTQRLPTAHISKTDTAHDTRVIVGPAPQQQLQQQTSQAVQASDSHRPALQAATAAAPAAAQTSLPMLHTGASPAQTARATLPAGAAASKDPAGQQRGPRWPGSCSQGAVIDANHLHGVAAVVVKARRSKSCSAGGRQHTAKTLVFQQVSLAQQSSLQGPGAPTQGFRTLPATAAGSHAKASAARQSVTIKQAAGAGAVAAPERQARQEVVRPSAGQEGVHLAEAGAAVAPQAVAPAMADVPAAAAVSQEEGSAAPVSNQHGHASSDGLDPHIEADKGSSGSQEQWETAVSKLHSLAEKHSQDSHEALAIDSAGNIGFEAEPRQEHISAPSDGQPLARKGDPATPGSQVSPVAGNSKHMQAMPQQVAVPGRPAAQAAALPGAAGQPQGLVDGSGTGVQACQGEMVSKAGAQSHTGLSRLRALMRQQVQTQQLGTDPLMSTGLHPGSSVKVATGLNQVQNSAGAPQLGQQHPQRAVSMAYAQHDAAKAASHWLGEARAEQGHKRKRLEAGACDQVMSHSAATASRMPSEQAPCKRQRLPISATHSSDSPAAHEDKDAERHSLVYGKRPAGAAQPSGLNAAQHSGPPQVGGGSASIHGSVPQVAWPTGCEPNLAPALQHDSQQPPPALPVAAAAGGNSAAAAAVNAENAVKAVVHVTATAAAEVGDASRGVAPVGQQDRSQGGSEAQQGGLRLDLSSEEDPLLCTQKLPSSQGTECLPYVKFGHRYHDTLFCQMLRFCVTPI